MGLVLMQTLTIPLMAIMPFIPMLHGVERFAALCVASMLKYAFAVRIRRYVARVYMSMQTNAYAFIRPLHVGVSVGLIYLRIH